ncbi:MAG: DoxX family protein [Planctomycetota bacterium]|nr:MAG: DoxX family protein [Planctomycetota bacterium]
MNDQVRCALAVVGRILLSAIFLMSAIANKIPNFNAVAEYAASEGVPMPKIMLAGGIVFLIAGGLSVLLGYRVRIGATLLLIFLILATYFFHDFWTMEDAAQQQEQMIHFMKNMALMGAMLLLIVNGPGPCNLEDYLRQKQGRAPAEA